MAEHLEFTLALHRQLAPAAQRSFCWSPYSVASALGLAAEAVDGAARDELDQVLRTGGDLTALVGMLGKAAELGAGGASEKPSIGVANTLWAHQDLSIRDAFLRGLKDWPGSAVRNAPFREDPDAARRKINEDVDRTTRGLIPELLEPGTVHPETVAALVNALYLKTSWTHAFDEHATASRPFHTTEGSRDVPTMRVTDRFGYADSDGWQVVTLPAVGDVEAVVLMPDTSLEDAERSLDPRRLADLLAAPRLRRLDLYLPKFDVNGAAELTDALGELGVRTLFAPGADFSPLTDEQLRVSTVVHQSVLRVDENGLEGAAATAVMMRMTAVIREEEPIEIRIDRPFLFLVRHRSTGAVYFLARVTRPD